MLGWDRHVHKACKACNPPVGVCNNPATKYVTEPVTRQNLLQGLLQACYRLVTGFNRYVTGFTYFLIKEKKIYIIISEGN